MAGADLEFFYWIDKAPVTGVLPFPTGRALVSLNAQAAAAGVGRGRVTVWLWAEKGWKAAFAMARKNGEGGDKPVYVVRDGAPPFQDADKAEFVYLKERA